MKTLAAVCLLVVSLAVSPACRSPPRVAATAPPSSVDQVVLSGQVVGREPGPDGEIQYFGPVHLSSRISGAPGVVSLRLEGVRFAGEGGAEALLYLVDPGRSPQTGRFDPRNYVGSAAAMAGQPGPVDITSEVHDFEANGERFLARTHLRQMAAVMIALVIRRGSVTFDRAVLAADPPQPQPNPR